MTSMRRSDQSKSYDPRSLSEGLRDIDQSLKRGVHWSHRVVQCLYTEPMFLALRSRPLAIIAGAVENVNNAEAETHGGDAHFVWEGGAQGARITGIHGLTPTSPPTEYRFTFLIAYGGR